MDITEDILHQLGLDVCDTMVGIPTHPDALPAVAGRWISASVSIQGLHRETLEVIAGEQLAAVIAREIFATPSDEVPSQVEMFDALGEIANQIGGNLKGIAGSEADLSLPVVRVLATPEAHVAEGTIRTVIQLAGYPLRLVFQSSTPRTFTPGFEPV